MKVKRVAQTRSALVRAALATLVVAGSSWMGSATGHAAQSDIDPRRSLVVTEQPILERFPLQRVLDQLVAQSGVPGLTSTALFQQWWDTQNPTPGTVAGPHCGDEVDAAGQPALNTFPYACRPAPAEGGEVDSLPFPDTASNPGAYVPIGRFNRFDLAPADGSHCGEHRIVCARRSGIATGNNRNLLIFEAMLPNPHPGQGLKGCFRIAKFWADLTTESALARRAEALERFYFTGVANVPPVVHVNHFGSNALGAGQIRTNQFMQTAASPRTWTLREFKLRRTCAGGACTALTMVPVTDKENPYGPLFGLTGSHPRLDAFQQHFVSQVATLAAATVPDIAFSNPVDAYNSGQSQASGSDETIYQLGEAPSLLRSQLEAALAGLGSALTPDNIVARAQALSCAGCHRLSRNADLGGGLVWPPSLGFTHVSERDTETVGGVTRFQISPALTDVFLPKRKQVLDDFMDDKPLNVRSPKSPIGGRRTH